MEHVAWKNILAAGWPVLSVLLIGSITTFAVLFERWRTYSKIEPNSKPFLESVRKAADIQKIIAWCENSDQPLAQITAHIFKAAASRDDKERALQRSIQIQVQTLETHVSVLGTIASVAPFVGLLGTVIGIIRAFRAVSMSASGGATMVALGIAEALVGTAAGLIVAIPALLAYNFFVNKLRRLTQDWEIVGSELVDLSLKNSRG